jgi:2-keto-4-pentenoate hydratase/2-oxohepta-3-ene-1,7-dioic acid hydratase in catechol pathway
MKLLRYSVGTSAVRLRKLVGDGVIDLQDAAASAGVSMRRLLDDFAALRPALEDAAGTPLKLADVVLHAPIDDPQKFLAIGMNFQAHAAEAAAAGGENNGWLSIRP